MTPQHTALGRALAVSIVLHALLIGAGARLLLPPGDNRTAQAALSVLLREAPATLPLSSPELVLPSPTPPAQADKPLAKPNPQVPSRALEVSPPRLGGEAARTANQQMAQGMAYPLEAIERGLEGDVTVLLFLDAAGNVIATRVEAGSGHALLDAAALRAARTLRSLPDSAPREALLPVRFRLR